MKTTVLFQKNQEKGVSGKDIQLHELVFQLNTHDSFLSCRPERLILPFSFEVDTTLQF